MSQILEHWDGEPDAADWTLSLEGVQDEVLTAEHEEIIYPAMGAALRDPPSLPRCREWLPTGPQLQHLLYFSRRIRESSQLSAVLPALNPSPSSDQPPVSSSTPPWVEFSAPPNYPRFASVMLRAAFISVPIEFDAR